MLENSTGLGEYLGGEQELDRGPARRQGGLQAEPARPRRGVQALSPNGGSRRSDGDPGDGGEQRRLQQPFRCVKWHRRPKPRSRANAIGAIDRPTLPRSLTEAARSCRAAHATQHGEIRRDVEISSRRTPVDGRTLDPELEAWARRALARHAQRGAIAAVCRVPAQQHSRGAPAFCPVQPDAKPRRQLRRIYLKASGTPRVRSRGSIRCLLDHEGWWIPKDDAPASRAAHSYRRARGFNPGCCRFLVLV